MKYLLITLICFAPLALLVQIPVNSVLKADGSGGSLQSQVTDDGTTVSIGTVSTATNNKLYIGGVCKPPM